MSHSVKSDLDGISKMILKNARGDIIYIQDMHPRKKISNTGELKHQDNNTTQTEDLFYQKLEDDVKSNLENTHYLILKSESGEDLPTFVKVIDKQGENERFIVSSSKTNGSSILTAAADLFHQESDTAHELVLPALEDIDCYQILPGNEICFM